MAACELAHLVQYLLPQWAFVTPFAMPTDSYFRPPGPPSLDSAKYLAVLAMFYGTDTFTSSSDFLPVVTREFTGFSAAAREAALSRLYGGIHFRSAIEDGLSGGIAIGEWTFTHFLQPSRNRSRK